MSISREEAIEFVRDKLGIEDIENTSIGLQLLNRIARCLQSEVPFQNLMLYKTPPERRFPTAEEVVSSGLSLTGGICIHDNWFASMLLEAIGFDLFTIIGVVNAAPDLTYEHPMIVVRGLSDPDDREQKHTQFLVDVGMGYPTPGCVPLHRLPFQFPVTAGFELRYNQVNDMYYRFHRQGYTSTDPNCPLRDNCWAEKLVFTLKPCDPATTKSSMERVYETEPPSYFMRMLRIFRWPKDSDDSIVAIRGQDLLLFGTAKYDEMGKNMTKQKTKIELDDLEDTILKYFPNFDPAELKEALPIALKISNLRN